MTFPQTPSSTLGVALQFQNYELKPKDMKSCDQGWWKISEVMYLSIMEFIPMNC